MKDIKEKIINATLILIILTFLTGFIYPVTIYYIGNIFFKEQANGSLIAYKNKIVGSKYIGQKFTSNKYFHGRPSAIDYNSNTSGASNFSVIDLRLKNEVQKRKKQLLNAEDIAIPDELLFASASGLDPEITVKSAIYQVNRIGYARNMSKIQKESLIELIKKSVTNVKREYEFWSKDRVNVLLLNIELDKIL